MSAALEFPRLAREAAVPTWPVVRLTVEDYQRLTEIGVLHEDDQIELLEGWLVPKVSKNTLQDGTVEMLFGMLNEVLPGLWHWRGQNPLLTPDSVPESDIAVVHGKRADFRRRHPNGHDTALVVELADSSISLDRKRQ